MNNEDPGALLRLYNQKVILNNTVTDPFIICSWVSCIFKLEGSRVPSVCSWVIYFQAGGFKSPHRCV